MTLRLLSDEGLLHSLHSLVLQEARIDAAIIEHLLEIEERRIHLESACPSMFEFLTRKMGMSDPAAGRRIAAARIVKRFPKLIEVIASRRIHLSGLLELERLLLDPQTTAERADELVALASGKSKRAVQELVASLAPQADAPSGIRILPEQQDLTSAAGAPDAGSHSTRQSESRVTPSSANRYTVQLTADRELLEKIERAQDLMRHQNPSGDLARLMSDALDALLEKLDKQRLAKPSPNRKTPRPVPRAKLDGLAVRRAAR